MPTEPALPFACFGEPGQTSINPERFALFQPASSWLLGYPNDAGLRRRWEIYVVGIATRFRGGQYETRAAARAELYKNYVPYSVALPACTEVELMDTDNSQSDEFRNWTELFLFQAYEYARAAGRSSSQGKHLTLRIRLQACLSQPLKPCPLERYECLSYL